MSAASSVATPMAGSLLVLHPCRWMHRFIEHTGEIQVELEAASEVGIFEAALEAFAELASADGDREPASHRIELATPDRALLLADWLNEFVYLAEVADFVPGTITAFELVGDQLRATVAGHRDHPRQLVKAVTLNDLELTEVDGRWHGRVVLDV